MFATSIRISKLHFLVLSGVLLFLGAVASSAQTSPNPAPKIYAQKLVEEILAAHPELMGAEFAATPPGKTECVIIASDEPKAIGVKCDLDELTAIKTNNPFVDLATENGKKFYDVVAPLHDPNGKIIATVGIDFKPEPGQSAAKATERFQKIVKGLESKITSEGKLFEPAS